MTATDWSPRVSILPAAQPREDGADPADAHVFDLARWLEHLAADAEARVAMGGPLEAQGAFIPREQPLRRRLAANLQALLLSDSEK